MSGSVHNRNKQLVNKLRAMLYDIEPDKLRDQLQEVFAHDAKIQLCFPFETLDGPLALYETVYVPLLEAIPDLERRDFIVMAGSDSGANVVGCGGHYMGVFEQPWLDIPATRHLVAMRYHEFFIIEDDKIVEMQAIWDIPQVMMQANAWPLSPSLGVEIVAPAPATNDGIITAPYDQAKADASLKLVVDMINSLQKSSEGHDKMQLDNYWHPKMMWYGPAGIGSMRRISGFRNWHQIPFLKAMPDRGLSEDPSYFFADGDYVGFTAWPAGMTLTISADGWLGIPPINKPMTMRSLDFWRCENGMIRENWVLVDLLETYHLIGVDVFERMREVTIARQPRPLWD